MKTQRKSGGGKLLLTRNEIAAEIGVSVRTIDRMTTGETQPHIPCVRIGNLVRYSKTAVLKALGAEVQ
jgi:DNA-binding XRE family transcriptional regulator